MLAHINVACVAVSVSVSMVMVSASHFVECLSFQDQASAHWPTTVWPNSEECLEILLLCDENDYKRCWSKNYDGRNLILAIRNRCQEDADFSHAMVEFDAQLSVPLPDQTRNQPVAVGSEFPCMCMDYVLYKLRNDPWILIIVGNTIGRNYF